MLPEDYHRWFAIATVVLVFLCLQLRRGAPTDLLFLLALIGVTLAGVITPEDAFRGFSNPALLTIAGLLVVAAGLRSAGVLDWVGKKMLGSVETERSALIRLVPALIASSAFMLNTALVAMAAPVVVDWCRRKRISPSRLLLPVSYLTILGGVCTLIGTSTTLIANGILRTEQDRRAADVSEQLETGAISALMAEEKLELIEGSVGQMGLFELGEIGLPCAIVGAFFMIFVAPRLLPNRIDMIEQLGEQRREYLVEMQVSPACPLIGEDVESAGLRHLPGLFLIEIDRDGDTLTPISPQDVIHAGDRLIFTGVVSTIVDLERIPGLVPAADITYEIHPETRTRRRLTEVVLSRTSPLIGQNVREANFRRLYNAAVVAIHRNGVRLTNKIGSIGLEPGDTLLLQTRDDFVSAYRNSRDFYLVSSVEGDSSRRHDKARLAGSLVLGLIVWLVLGAIPGLLPANLASPAVASLTVAALMILTGCLRVSEARNALDIRVLVTIAAALGMGLALETSGAAHMIATGMITAVGNNPCLLLVVVYCAAIIMTELISNNAVAAMLLPLSIAIAEVGGVHPRPFILAVTLAASLSFATPIGYQTNLMVMGPGGYKPVDYLRCGGPLAILIAVTALPLLIGRL